MPVASNENCAGKEDERKEGFVPVAPNETLPPSGGSHTQVAPASAVNTQDQVAENKVSTLTHQCTGRPGQKRETMPTSVSFNTIYSGPGSKEEQYGGARGFPTVPSAAEQGATVITHAVDCQN